MRTSGVEFRSPNQPPAASDQGRAPGFGVVLQDVPSQIIHRIMIRGESPEYSLAPFRPRRAILPKSLRDPLRPLLDRELRAEAKPVLGGTHKKDRGRVGVVGFEPIDRTSTIELQVRGLLWNLEKARPCKSLLPGCYSPLLSRLDGRHSGPW